MVPCSEPDIVAFSSEADTGSPPENAATLSESLYQLSVRPSSNRRGASGVTLDYPPIRHANNLEAVLTYEGTEEIHALAIGQALTGLSAYR